MRDDDDFFKPFDGYDDDDDDDRQGSGARGRRFASPSNPPVDGDDDDDDDDFYGDSPFRKALEDHDDQDDFDQAGFGRRDQTDDDDDELDDEVDDDFVDPRARYDDDEYVDYAHGVNTYDTGARRGMRQWVGVGVALVAGLMIASVGLMKVFGTPEKKAGTTATSVTNTFVPTTQPTDTTEPTTVTTKPAGHLTTVEQIESQVRGGMTAWEDFSVDGKTDGLKDYFDEDGPQYKKLVQGKDKTEGIHYKIKPTYLEVLEGSKVRRMVILDASVTSDVGGSWKYQWQVEMQKVGDKWLIYEIRKRG